MALSSCRPSVTPTAHRTDGQVQLVYQDWRTTWFPPMAQEMLEQFHEAHPDIRVFYTPDPPDLEDHMLSDMRAGTAADVFQGCCTHFPSWAQQGFTLDLAPYVEADVSPETIAEWDPVQYRSLATRDGLQFGLPKYRGSLVLFYNRDLFDDLGLAYPNNTWDQDSYAAAMRVCSGENKEEQQLWGSMLDLSWERVQVHVNAWGGHLIDPANPKRCLMATPPALDALEWLRQRMWDEHVMATPLDVQNMGTSDTFVSGKLAMVEEGSWALKTILAAPFRVGVAPLPSGPSRRASLVTTDGFGIFSGSRYREAAWELVKFLISADYGRAMAKAHLLQPARVSLMEDWMGFVRAEFPKQADGLDLSVFADSQIHGYSVTGEIGENMEAVQRIAYAAWDRIFVLGEQPVDSLSEACEAIENATGYVGGDFDTPRGDSEN
ncbi:MAG: ABC transporter substrate-binding protein [Anaerolineae bacterium]